MAAQRRRPTQLDGAHHPPLDAAQVTIMPAAIRVAVAAEDIRTSRPIDIVPPDQGGRHDLQRQPVERALGPPDQPV